MNRQHRRQSQRQGQGAGGDPGPDAPLTDAELVGASMADAAVETDAQLGTLGSVRSRNGRAAATAVVPVRHRLAPRQFLHEVNVELRKVAWPTRAETINYSTVVLVTLAVLMALIFALDLVFTKLAGFLFSP